MSIDDEVKKILEKKMRRMLDKLDVKNEGREDVKLIYNVNDSEFKRLVLQKSFSIPVLVDFWAPWCKPCHIVGPALEKAVKSLKGRVLLAKIDIEKNPLTAIRYGVMGIPTLMLFKRGKVVDRFVGAMPEDMMVRWLIERIY